jgi:phospholipid/cholesterol/gamma-HCH transport system substrate-binding protein
VKNLSASVKVGVLVLLLIGGAYAVWKSIGTSPSGSDNYELWAKFRDASGMPVGSHVVIAGLPVGEISKLGIEGRYARVTIRVRDDVQVWSNSVAMKKSASLLGSYYLEIDPGSPTSATVTGEVIENHLLEDGDQIQTVVEATSPAELMRRLEESLPNVDAVLLSVRDLSNDLRRLVNGPIASVASRVDQLVQDEAETVERILERTDRSLARIETITVAIRDATTGEDAKMQRILTNLEQATSEARELMVSARTEVETTGDKVREKLDLVDELLASSASVANKIDDDEGTLGRLVNDPTIADNVEEITEGAKDFLGGVFGMQTYVGLRSEYNVFSELGRFYVTVELRTRPDKFYLIELQKSPRGDYPETTLVYDPLVDRNTWTRRVLIEDKVRFTFQFGKRIGDWSLRYGLKDSTGGVGVDWQPSAFDHRLKVSADVFDATFNTLPRLKLAAAYEFYRHLYVLGGIDDALNTPTFLNIDPGEGDPGLPVPIQFEKLRYGRDYFLGAMIYFNDRDLASLLYIGGAAVAGLAD